MACPKATQKKRRCWEDRWDFTSQDDPYVFPIYINPKGQLYGFCPAKVTREPAVYSIYKILIIASQTGAMLKSGGIEEQPEWFIDLLAWFIPMMDMMNFTTKAGMVLGKDDKHKDAVKKAKSRK